MNHAGLVYAADAATGAQGYGDVIAMISAVAALASVAITSLRKRKDVSVKEMEDRIVTLEGEGEEAAADLRAAKASSIRNARHLFTVRQLLAAHGIEDPTTKEGE